MTCRPQGKRNMWNFLLKSYYEFWDPASRGGKQTWSSGIGCMPVKQPLLWGLASKSHWRGSNEPKDEKYETWPERLSKLQSSSLSQLCHPRAWYIYHWLLFGARALHFTQLPSHADHDTEDRVIFVITMKITVHGQLLHTYWLQMFSLQGKGMMQFRKCQLSATGAGGFGCPWFVSWQLY